MLFALSKIGGFLLLPSNAIALLCAAGVALAAAGRHRPGLWIAGAGVGALLVLGFSPAGNILMLTLSERFPAWQPDAAPPDGIIVLGGAIDPDVSAARGAVEFLASGERVLAARDLARRFPGAQVVFSGGSARLLSKGASEAAIAGRVLSDLGIDPRRIVLESRSRTTDENARFSRDLLAPKPGQRWLLVTTAYHMPRAVGAFRAAGFHVEAYPVDWRTPDWSAAAEPFARLSHGLGRSDAAVREWIGLLVYWLTGRSSALFPGP